MINYTSIELCLCGGKYSSDEVYIRALSFDLNVVTLETEQMANILGVEVQMRLSAAKEQFESRNA